MAKKLLGTALACVMVLFSFSLIGYSTSPASHTLDKDRLGKTADDNATALLISQLTAGVEVADKNEYDFTERAMEYLEYIGKSLEARGEGETNASGTREIGDWIIEELTKVGYSDESTELQEFDYEDATGDKQKGRNIIVTVEGEDPSKQIIAGAHYDGEGVGDNASGVALLLAHSVELADVKPHYTVKYIFFDAEEVGCVGSEYYVQQMTEKEVDSTLFMINMDALAFGDYCNIYGGDIVKIMEDDPDNPKDTEDNLTEAYDFAADTAEKLGFTVLRTDDLDGYFEEHGTGPEIQDNTLYTNPWTSENPSPSNYSVPSPATLPASDHIGFTEKGIEYIYFEATNWFAEGENDDVEASSYTGYIETYDYSIGDHGMFMNTEHDTWENLNKYFPGRAEAHFRIYSPLLSALLLAR